jgi:hypothetical protein
MPISGTNSHKAAATLAAAILLGFFRASAQDVPPPPKPKDDGPNLEDTMKFIQDKMNEQDSVGYASTKSDLAGVTFREFYKISSVVADAVTCSLKTVETTDTRIDDTPPLHTYFEDGQQVEGDNLSRRTVSKTTIRLKDVERIRVEHLQDVWNRHSAEAAHPEITFAIAPPVYSLTLVASKPVFLFHTTFTRGNEAPKGVDSSSKTDMLHFRDEEMANRVAKAFVHAVELCGGGRKDPF